MVPDTWKSATSRSVFDLHFPSPWVPKLFNSVGTWGGRERGGGGVIKWIPGSFTPCNSASHQQLKSGKASRQTRASHWINDLPESAEAHLDWFHGLAWSQSESECTYAELILIPNWPISQHAPSTWAGERRANTEWQSAQPKNGSWLGDALIDSRLLKLQRHWGETRIVKKKETT